MDTPTLYSKLATVPMPIKNQLGSETTIDAQDAIEHQFNLPNGSSAIIGKLIQRLQIKDLDAAYFTGTLAAELNLERNKALSISEEIKRSILAPIKDDLSQYGIDISSLDKFQTPPPVIKSSQAPPTTSAPSVPGPKIISETFAATPKATAGMPPVATAKNVTTAPAVPASPQPRQPFDAGWSKKASQGPVVKLGAITPGIPAPTTMVVPSIPAAPSSPKSPTPPQPAPVKAMGEFERLDIMKGGPTPATPPPASQPAPVMLHEVSNPAQQKTPDFKIDTGMQNQMSAKSPQAAAPARTAVIEFGGTGAAGTGSSAIPSSSSVPKTVHYTQYQPSQDDTGPRQITQITQPKQQVTTPPPPAPQAPMPSTPSKNEKVIVQDFLGPQK